MQINTIPDLNAGNVYGKYTAGIGGTDEVKGTETAAVGGTTPNLTITDSNGQSYVQGLENPTLGNSEESVVNCDDLQDAYDSFKQIADDLEQTQQTETGNVQASSISTCNSSAFDIYALMALMTDTSETLKQTSRELRNSELEQEKNMIHSQADLQREGAMLSLAVGAAFTAVSIGMTAVSTFKSVSSMNTQINMTNQTDIPHLNQDVKITGNVTAEVGNQAQVQQMQAKTGMTTEAANELTNRYFGDADATAANYTEAKSATQQSTSAVANKVTSDVNAKGASASKTNASVESTGDVKVKGDVQSGSGKSQEIEMQNLSNKDSNSASVSENNGSKVDNSKSGNSSNEVNNDASAKNNSEKIEDKSQGSDSSKVGKSNDDTETPGNPDSDSGKVEDIRQSARDQYTKGMEKYDGDIAAKKSEVALKQQEVDYLKANGGSKDKIAQVEGELSTAKNELKNLENNRGFMKAYEMDAKAKISTSDELTTEQNTIEMKAETQSRMIQNSPEYLKAQKQATKWGGIQQLSNSVNSLGQSLSQTMSGMSQAASVDEQAEQKEAEARYDEANDFMHSAQDLMNAVLKLCGAIIDVENSTNQAIIRG